MLFLFFFIIFKSWSSTILLTNNIPITLYTNTAVCSKNSVGIKMGIPLITLVSTIWRQASKHAMVVDLAHPDCGLLSSSVVPSLCEQSPCREEGRHGGLGGRGVQLSLCRTLTPLVEWREGGFHGTIKVSKWFLINSLDIVPQIDTQWTYSILSLCAFLNYNSWYTLNNQLYQNNWEQQP